MLQFVSLAASNGTQNSHTIVTNTLHLLRFTVELISRHAGEKEIFEVIFLNQFSLHPRLPVPYRCSQCHLMCCIFADRQPLISITLTSPLSSCLLLLQVVLPSRRNKQPQKKFVFPPPLPGQTMVILRQQQYLDDVSSAMISANV